MSWRKLETALIVQHLELKVIFYKIFFNPLNAELNPICNLLALFGTHPVLHVSRIRVKRTRQNHF